jgi:hypothetical protein
MPVFHRGELKVLYIHVPRTGGTSIELFFEKNGFKTEYLDRGQTSDTLNRVRTCSPQHMDADILKKIFKISAFSYIFMTVRHPLERLLSAYRFRASQEKSIPDLTTWTGTMLRAYADNPYVLDNHIRPQSDFWVHGCEVFRQEIGFGPSWVRKISERLQTDFVESAMDTAMRYPSRPDQETTLGADCAALSRHFYRNDYSLFEYT